MSVKTRAMQRAFDMGSFCCSSSETSDIDAAVVSPVGIDVVLPRSKAEVCFSLSSGAEAVVVLPAIGFGSLVPFLISLLQIWVFLGLEIESFSALSTCASLLMSVADKAEGGARPMHLKLFGMIDVVVAHSSNQSRRETEFTAEDQVIQSERLQVLFLRDGKREMLRT